MFGRRNDPDLCRTLKDIEAKRWLNVSTVKDDTMLQDYEEKRIVLLEKQVEALIDCVGALISHLQGMGDNPLLERLTNKIIEAEELYLHTE